MPFELPGGTRCCTAAVPYCTEDITPTDTDDFVRKLNYSATKSAVPIRMYHVISYNQAVNEMISTAPPLGTETLLTTAVDMNRAWKIENGSEGGCYLPKDAVSECWPKAVLVLVDSVCHTWQSKAAVVHMIQSMYHKEVLQSYKYTGYIHIIVDLCMIPRDQS